MNEFDQGTYRHRPNRCAGCGRLMDSITGAAAAAGQRPRVGDYTACIACATIHRIDPDSVLVAAGPDEVARLLEGEGGALWRRAIALIRTQAHLVQLHPERFN
jgi:hypothetical protein